MKIKKIVLVVMVVLFVLFFWAAFANAQSPQIKCPANAKCGLFTGSNKITTVVQAEVEAVDKLNDWNIHFKNEGTMLVWRNRCNRGGCFSWDLTGRKHGAKVADKNLNSGVKITMLQKNMVRLDFIEYGGNAYTAVIIDGKLMPVQKL
jgi:hypothetical protein